MTGEHDGALAGKVAVVTGGARGIGLAIAKALASRGADIAVWDVLEDAAAEAAREIEGAGVVQPVKAYHRRVDVTNAADVEAAVSETVSALGKIGILVNNAGITRDGMFLRMDEADWEAVLAVNLKGAFLCSKAAARAMRKTRNGTIRSKGPDLRAGGAIVNVASIVGMIGNAGQANYSASKAGLIGLTKTCARELARYGIRANAVAPGFIDTEMTRKLSEEAQKQIAANIPLGRFGTVDDVAAAVAFLAGPESEYVTGQVLRVCGGLVM